MTSFANWVCWKHNCGIKKLKDLVATVRYKTGRFCLPRSVNPLEAIGYSFDPEKFKKLYVDRASKINTSYYANGSTNVLSVKEN